MCDVFYWPSLSKHQGFIIIPGRPWIQKSVSDFAWRNWLWYRRSRIDRNWKLAWSAHQWVLGACGWYHKSCSFIHCVYWLVSKYSIRTTTRTRWWKYLFQLDAANLRISRSRTVIWLGPELHLELRISISYKEVRLVQSLLEKIEESS